MNCYFKLKLTTIINNKVWNLNYQVRAIPVDKLNISIIFDKFYK